MASRCFLIANPVSGSTSPAKVQMLMERLRESALEPELLLTSCAEDAGRFARRICDEEAAPTILVAGGDGTINGVLNGLTPGKATLGVLPLGTSNVLARELEIHSLEDALVRCARGASRPVSVGELSWEGGSTRFLLMAGIGIDGAVVEGVRLPEKRALGKGAYLLSALRTLARWDAEKLTVTTGDTVLSCHSVIVCNAAKYAGNFVLAPGADLFSRGFQLLCISGGRGAFLRLGLRLLAGSVSQSPAVTMVATDELEIAGTKCVQLDGDYCRRCPVTIRSLPEFMRLIV